MGRPKKNQVTEEVGEQLEEKEVVLDPEVAEETEQVSEQVEEKVDTVKEAENANQDVEDVPVYVGPDVDIKVQNLLRIFNSYDEIYITKTGGVFPKNNKPSFVKDAVLYKNPFFKNVN